MAENKDAEQSPNNSCSNIAVDEIDNDTSKKLRGDAIGDTMYSEVFVLNTLLQFSDLKWSTEIEDNLCFLWDMTEETDVCQYLFKQAYPALACSAIENYNESRFVEIVIGIFANILCSKCEKSVNVEHIKIVLNLLNSDDPYILIQVMRFVHATAYMFKKLDFIEDVHLVRFDFILSNSSNKELLTNSLKTLAAITEDFKINQDLVKGDLVNSVVVAFRTLKEEVESHEVFERQDKHTDFKYMIQFLCNFCSYINNFNMSRSEINLNEFTNEVILLLQFYKLEDHLCPLDDEFKFYVEALTYIYRILNLDSVSLLARNLYDIVSILYKNGNDVEFVVELFCYLISIGTLQDFKQDFENVNLHEVRELLGYIDQKKFSFEFEYQIKLRQILNEI